MFILISAILLAGIAVVVGHARGMPVCGDYTAIVSVDKAEKIAPALSNAVRHVEQKGFVVVDIDIQRRSFLGWRQFVITCRGADEATLLRFED